MYQGDEEGKKDGARYARPMLEIESCDIIYCASDGALGYGWGQHEFGLRCHGWLLELPVGARGGINRPERRSLLLPKLRDTFTGMVMVVVRLAKW